MENHMNSVSLHSELKILLLQLVEIFKDADSPNLEKIEQLSRLTIRQKVDYLDAIIDLFEIEDRGELLEVILLSFVLKILREYVSSVKNSKEKFTILLNKTVDLVKNEYSDPYFTSKMLEFLRSYLALSPEYITFENFQKVWNALRPYFRIQESSIAQSNHDSALKCIKSFFSKYKELNIEALSDESKQIMLFVFEELSKEITTLTNLLKNETKHTAKKEYLKSLENLCSCLILSLEYLTSYNLQFLQTYFFQEFSYNVLQLSDLEESSLLSLSLSFHSLIWKIYKQGSCEVKSILSTLFNQVIMRPLQKFSSKFTSNAVKERDILNLHHLISHIIMFIEQQENVAYIFVNNDLSSLKKQIFDEILTSIFNIGKKAGETLNQLYSREIFDIILEFLHGSLDVEESPTIHTENVPEEERQSFLKLLSDSQKFEKYALLHNKSAKDFLNQINSEYYIDESLEEKAEKIAYFLHLSHYVQSDKVIELVGMNKPLNLLILEKYIKGLDFTNMQIVNALRLLFINFLMVGEAQVVERVILEFVKHYYASLPPNAVFKSRDALHTFTYALIMLHTDLHKPVIVERMTPEQFITNVKGVNDGENLPEDYLRECYQYLKQTEIKTLKSRDLSLEENITKETWKNYLKTIEMYDSRSSIIYSKRDKIINPTDIKELDTLVNYHCYKKLVLKVIENIELFMAKSILDPQSIDLLFEKLVKASVHFEMAENLDNLMTSLANMAEVSVNFDFTKKNDLIFWNLFCTFLVAKKTLLYLDGSLPIVAKLLIGTMSFRNYVLEDKIATKYFSAYKKIKQATKFLSKAASKSSFFDALSSFLSSKDDDSSDEEQNDLLVQRDRASAERTTVYKKFFFDANILEEIFEQTKFLSEPQILKLLDSAVFDSSVLEGIEAKPMTLMSVSALCSEIAFRNYDRPALLWKFISSLFINIAICPNPNRVEIDPNLRPVLDSLISVKSEKFNEALNEVVKKHSKKMARIQSYVHYLLLELCVCFSHKCEELYGFESILKYSLDFLNDCSLPVVMDFLTLVQETTNSHKSTQNHNLRNWIYIARILKKLLESLDKKNLEIPEVKDACLKCGEVITDMLLKFSFLSDHDFLDSFKEVVSLLVMYEKTQFVSKFRLTGIVSGNLYMLMNIFVGLEKNKTPEYAKECSLLLIPIIEVVNNIVLNSGPEEIVMAFKLFQKVIYLLKPGEWTGEKVTSVFKKLLEMEKKIIIFQDENLNLVYVETLGKFLLTHIEKLEQSIQKELLLGYYHKFFELFINSQTKKQKTLVETIVESLVNTTRTLLDLKLITNEAEKIKEDECLKKIVGVLEKFPKDSMEFFFPQAGSPVK